MLTINLISTSILLLTSISNASPIAYNSNVAVPDTNQVQAIGEQPHTFIPILIVDRSEADSVLTANSQNRAAISGSSSSLPVPLPMGTLETLVHTDAEIAHIQAQAELNRYNSNSNVPEGEVEPLDSSYEAPIAAPIKSTAGRISRVVTGSTPPATAYNLEELDELASEAALAQLDSPKLAATSNNVRIESVGTPSTSIYYDDATATYNSHNQVDIEPEFVGESRISTSTTTTATDAEEIPVTYYNEETANYENEDGSVAYSSRIAETTTAEDTTPEVGSVPVTFYNDETARYEFSDGSPVYPSSEIAGAKSRISTAATTDESIPVTYYNEVTGNYEFENGSVAYSYAGTASRISTAEVTTEEATIPVTYYNEATGHYEYEDGSFASVNKGAERIATAATADVDTSSTPLLYDDADVGAYATTSDEEISSEYFAGKARFSSLATAAVSSTAPIVAVSSTYIQLPNWSKSNQVSLNLQYSPPADSRITISFIDVIIRLVGTAQHTPSNVEYVSPPAYNNLKVASGKNQYPTNINFILTPYCGIFDIQVYEKQMVAGNPNPVYPYPTTVARVNLICSQIY